MLPAVLGIFLLVIFYFDLAVNREIDQLPNRHERINPHRLFYGDLQRPVAAKAHIALACSCVNVDAQAARARLTLEEGHVRMCLRIFIRNAQVKLLWLQYDPFFRYLEMLDGIVFP